MNRKSRTGAGVKEGVTVEEVETGPGAEERVTAEVIKGPCLEEI